MSYREAKLTASPLEASKLIHDPGLHSLNLSTDRDGFVYIPQGHTGPYPVLLMLHGAGGEAEHILPPFQDLADHTGTVLLIPESRRQTWDVIMGGFGPDVEFIDKALKKIFKEVPVRKDKIGVGGFSDGASYALSLGIANGTFFSHILAFSPGFMAPPQRRNSPPIFISHGVKDRVLNIDHCSRKLVPLLKNGGFEVLYREFNGDHTIPAEYAKEAFTWFLGPQEKEDVEASKVRIDPDLRNT